MALTPCLVWGQVGEGDGRLDVKKERIISLSGESLAPDPEAGAVSLQDFTLALALDRAPAAETVLVAWPDKEGGQSSLQLLADGSVQFRLRAGETCHKLQTPPGTVRPDAEGALRLVVSVRRDPRQALSGIWINGVELVSAAIPPGAVSFDPAQLQRASELPSGARWQQLDVYARALARWEVLDWGLMAGAGKDHHKRADARTLAVLGGSEAVAVMEEGTLEALYVSQHRSATGTTPRVRSLAWEGDTVFQRDRPLNFGGLCQQLRRVGTDTALLMFGRLECLEGGAAGLTAFKQALVKLVQECREEAGEIWLAGLPPFEKMPPPLPDLSLRNDELAAYDHAIRVVAAEQQAVFIDVRAAWPTSARSFTTDGINLSESGARLTGRLLLTVDDPTGLDSLRTLARAKNRLWNHFWRPSNWAFLHGDRTAQPSSRDHIDPRLRWFPAEMETCLRFVEEKESELAQAAAEWGRKLP